MTTTTQVTKANRSRIAASRCTWNNSVISSCDEQNASTRTATTKSVDPSDTDSSDSTTSSRQIDLSSISAQTDAGIKQIDHSVVTDCSNQHIESNTPAIRKSAPRITIMSASHNRTNVTSQENSDVEDSAHDDGIFSTDVSPAESSDEVTIVRVSHWPPRPDSSNMDIGSDHDPDDGYDFGGSSRTDASDAEEDEVDELAVSSLAGDQEECEDEQDEDDDDDEYEQRQILNDCDDSLISSSISTSASSYYDSCGSLSSPPLTEVLINGKHMDMTSERYAVLSFDQVVRLDHVMDSLMPIHGRGNFPTLEVKLKDLVQVVRSKLVADGVNVRDIRLNGGAASYVISCMDEKQERSYSDLDLIFAVDLSNHRNFDKVRSAVLDSLLDFLPEGVNKKKMSSCTLKEAYVHKMVKVAEAGDRWSLISLCNNSGRDIEIKFVDTMKRQFEFSVDSFQIILDSLLLYYECSESMAMSENIYPTVVGESVYGNFGEALLHLQHRQIATRNPEEIRGGGLLKYCRLMVMGYTPENLDQIRNMEKYMCSRFFIDFPDIGVQRVKLANYLNTHFHEDDRMKYDYLMILQQVVDESTVCLMGHERRQTLSLIEEFALHFYFQDPHHQQQQLPAPHPVIPRHPERPYHRQVSHNKTHDPHYGGGGRRHAGRQEIQSKKSHHHNNFSSNFQQQQSVASHPHVHAPPVMHHQQQAPHHQQQQPPHAQQTQTLVLSSGSQFYYTPAAFPGNVTYQTTITQSNPPIPQHGHYHHHHHHCHNHLPHAHQNFGCFNCCSGGPAAAGHCSVSWLPCA